MDYILQEQGFQQSGACNSNECIVEMGQLLGVEFLLSGRLVRFGSTFAMHLEYIDVGTGVIVKTVDTEAQGELGDIYKDLCKNLALSLDYALNPEKAPAPHTAESAPAVFEATNDPATPAEVTVPTVVPSVVEQANTHATLQAALPTAKPKFFNTRRKIAVGLLLLGTGSTGIIGALQNEVLWDNVDSANRAREVGDRAAYEKHFNKVEDAEVMRNTIWSISIAAAAVSLLLFVWPGDN